MTPQTYASPQAFKQALETRLRTSAATGPDFARRRQILVFQRFLARMVATFGADVTLKGGLALELRIERARTTKDVDLRLLAAPTDLLQSLRTAGQRDLGDFMSFQIAPDAEHPELLNDGLKYDGLRFRVECAIAGKIYGQPFGVDIVLGEPFTGEPDTVVGPDTLAFAGVAPPVVRIYPLEAHIAEKLHAYTLPRARPNTRIKDLPDIALLATARTISAVALRGALDQTFRVRTTHPLPTSVPMPPESWEKPYRAMATENELPWRDLDEVVRVVRAFLDPVLVGHPNAEWRPDAWAWIG